MDPFTIAASVAKITSSCLVTGKAIYDISCKYQDAPRNMVAISSEMTVVSASLSHIQTLILSKQDSESLLRSRPEIAATLDTALTGCMVLFSCLDEEIKNVTKHARRLVAFSWKGKIKVAWKHETFQELLDGIRGQQLAISTLIQLLQTDSLLEITKLLQRNAPELQKTVERTRSLRLSHPKIEVAMSLYNQEGQDSLYAATECFQAPSELEFDFDDIVVNSAAYRRALAEAQRQIPVTQQDDSGGLVNNPDDVKSPQTMISQSTHVRALHGYSKDNPLILSVREGDIFEILMETPNGWSYGRMDGVAGWLPSNYYEIIPPPSDYAQEALNGLSSVASMIDEPHLEEEDMPTEPTEEERLAFEKLCEEKTAEYAQMVQEIQAEKLQRIAKYAARQSELDRLQEEHKRDTELNRQAREEYERIRKESQQRIQELFGAQKAYEARKAREDGRTLDDIQQQREPVLI